MRKPNSSFLSTVGFLVIISFVSILIFGCLFPRSQFNPVRLPFVRRGYHMTDSLKLVGRLNDTIFSQKEINALIDAIIRKDSIPDWWISKAKRPQLTFYYKSMCGQPLNFISRRFPISAAFIEPKINYNLYLGPLDVDSFNHNFGGLPNYSNFIDDKLTIIPKGDSLRMPDTIDILGYYLNYFKYFGKIDSGRYWVVLEHENELTLDTMPPIWTGFVTSDTLWFRITE